MAGGAGGPHDDASTEAIKAFATAQALSRTDEQALGKAREQLVAAGGKALLYELSCTTAFFDSMTRIVDATGHTAPAHKFAMMSTGLKVVGAVGGPRNLLFAAGALLALAAGGAVQLLEIA